MKTELLKLRNELKSAQLIVRLLQEERNNQSSDQRNFYNLSNSVEEEMNQTQLAVTENDREWQQVPNRKNIPNLLKKNTDSQTTKYSHKGNNK
jgi:vacuolar-type H+-ATPase subunit D/Vma8